MDVTAVTFEKRTSRAVLSGKLLKDGIIVSRTWKLRFCQVQVRTSMKEIIRSNSSVFFCLKQPSAVSTSLTANQGVAGSNPGPATYFRGNLS